MKVKRRRLINQLLWLAGFLLLWEIIADLMKYVIQDENAEKKLTSLHSVIMQFCADYQHLLLETGITFSRAMEGLAIGILVAVILAVLMSLSGIIEKIATPYLLLSQMIPILGLAPIVFNLVKDLDTARIVIAAYMSFFPISIALLGGFKAVDKSQRELLLTYNASVFQRYRVLMFPSALPYFFSGLKTAAPMSVTASILVDTLSVQDGIGQIIIYSLAGGGALGNFWPAVVLGSLMGVGSYYLAVLLEYIFVPWERGSNRK